MLAYPGWALRLAFWWLGGLRRRLRRPPAYVAFLLEAPLPEPAARPRARWQRLLGPPPLTLDVLAPRLRAAAADPRVKGVVLHLRPLSFTRGQIDALRDLIAEVRATGTRVICWAPSYTTATYWVACAADEILLQPGGGTTPLGLTRQYLFLAEALERVGLGADLIQVSPFKTAGDILTKRALTPEARKMADWLADADLADLVGAVAVGRHLDQAAATALIDASPFTDEQALAATAVDAVVVEDELPARLHDSVRDWAAAWRTLPRPRPLRPGRVVALLRVEGLIIDGRSRTSPVRPPIAPPILFNDQCGDLTVAEQARALARDGRVAAVVLWVDSGGGSATASEAMASALEGLARRKPLVAAMGSVAASGGYYVTTPAQRVFAHPGTVTGSIGVIGGKLVAGGLLDRLLLHREVVQRGQHASMYGAEAPFTEEERTKAAELIDRMYRQFLARVSVARGRPVEELLPVAGGRVWTGRQALEHGLVDELGGLESAAAAARRLAGLRPDAPLRETRARGREPLLPPATVPAVLTHALTAVASLRQSTAWCLSPLIDP